MTVDYPDPYRQGLADAAVEIVATKRLPNHISAAEIGRVLGLTHQELVQAVDRFKVRRRAGSPLTPVIGRRRLAIAASGSSEQLRPSPLRAPGPAPAGQKWCGWHGAFHDLADFGPNRSAKDGLQNYCRSANREAQRATRERRKARS